MKISVIIPTTSPTMPKPVALRPILSQQTILLRDYSGKAIEVNANNGIVKLCGGSLDFDELCDNEHYEPLYNLTLIFKV